jgi:alanine racemase
MSEGATLRLTIDLAALAENWRRLAAASDPAECSAVVKADAYGVGIEPAVAALTRAGCRTFFVALPFEGERVRRAAPEAIVYVLNGLADEAADRFREARLRPVLNSLDEVDHWLREAPGENCALHIDTGMNRLGLSLHEALEFTRRREDVRTLAPKLLMSHLATADTPDHPLSREQLALFEETKALFPDIPGSLANSAGIALGPAYHFDLVRPGIALYGGRFAADRQPLATVVTAEARVLQVREAAEDETVGYGATERLTRPSRLAILGAGYADGYIRAAGSSSERPGALAYVRGQPARLVGRVSMDLIAIDVTDVPAVRPGDYAELFGPRVPIDEVAGHAGTIGYELLTGLSRRAERVYVGAETH